MITFVRRLRMRNGHFSEATEMLRQRIDYFAQHHNTRIELRTRFGGPVGEVALVSYHADAGELELFRRKISSDIGSDKLLEKLADFTLPGETQDEIWMS